MFLAVVGNFQLHLYLDYCVVQFARATRADCRVAASDCSRVEYLQQVADKR